jgi:large subunit ribosomal protein L4
VVEDFSYSKPKTSTFTKFLSNLELSDKKVLLLTAKNEKNINLSASNIPKVAIRDSITFSTYDVLYAEKLIVQESALQKINEVLGK